MRIAYFTETFLPKIDGVVNTLCHLLEHLHQRNHESIVFAPSGCPSHYASTSIIEVPSCPFPIYPELRIASPWTDFGSQLADFKPDIVHVLAPFFLGAAGLRSARKLGIPIIASYHTDIPGYAKRYGFPFLSNLFWRYLHSLHEQSQLNLCPSQPVIDELASHGFSKLKLWSRGVNTQLFSPERRSDSMRDRLTEGHSDAPLLLYVGRLAAEKRTDWLKQIPYAIPNARLAIVGDGPERQSLERAMRNLPVVFTGYLRGLSLAQAYASADLFIFPSANETFGNVLLEAMASGLPVVTAASGGPLDIVKEGETGLLFPAQSREMFIRSVRDLTNNLSKRLVMSHACRDFAETNSWNAVMNPLLKDYEHVISSNQGQSDVLHTH